MLKKILLITIPLLAIFALGIFIGTKIKTKTSNGNTDSFQAGWDAAQKRLEESGAAPKLNGIEIKTLSGTIQQIEGEKITLKTTNILGALSDPELDNRIVQVNNETKIYLLIPKDNTVLQKETEEFNNKLKEQANQAADLQIPLPFDKKEVSLAELKVGQNITVQADEDIKDKKQFTAKEISIQAGLEPALDQQAAQNPAATQSQNLPAPSAPTTNSPASIPAPSAPSASANFPDPSATNAPAPSDLPAPSAATSNNSAPAMPSN